MRWGLIPAKVADPDTFKIFSTTNARAETILDKPIWKGPFQTSRCLVLLDGFYEWLQRPSLPQPPPAELGERGLFGDIAPHANPPSKPKAGSRPVYKFEMANGAPYALAGLFSEWRPRRGDSRPALDTFSIVTTEANELTDPIHDRMPVILHPRDYDRWLNDYDESRPPLDLLRPYESEGLHMTPANRSVGNVRNDGPEMLNSA
jgi:putative SOS response-associated peptidase YedK